MLSDTLAPLSLSSQQAEALWRPLSADRALHKPVQCRLRRLASRPPSHHRHHHLAAASTPQRPLPCSRAAACALPRGYFTNTAARAQRPFRFDRGYSPD